MVVDCDATGQPRIYHGTETNIFDDATGVNAVKILELQDATCVNTCGLSEISYDAVKSRSNLNATRTASGWATNLTTHVPVHELLHLMGATQGFPQPGAPFSTPGSHCIDGLDVLCYGDGTGSSWGFYTEDRCPAGAGYNDPVLVPLDCGRDTYFNPTPPGGSYLATHWDVAGPENPYLSTVTTQAPIVTTNQPSPVGVSSATLQGSITPRGEYAWYQFQYMKESDYQAQGWGRPKSACGRTHPTGAHRSVWGERHHREIWCETELGHDVSLPPAWQQ